MGLGRRIRCSYAHLLRNIAALQLHVGDLCQTSNDCNKHAAAAVCAAMLDASHIPSANARNGATGARDWEQLVCIDLDCD